MPNAIIQIDPSFQTISHATRHKSKSTGLLVAIYPILSAQQEGSAMETHDLFIVVAAPIQTGLHQTVPKNVWTVRDLQVQEIYI